MSVGIIVSYDGTPNDEDGLALGRMLAKSGATLALAYVRHAGEYDPRREEIAQHDADQRLEQGAAWLGDPSVARHIVINPSTGEGLTQLAESVGASLIVFGSDYRTPPGSVEPGTTAQHLLEGGPIAVAVALAGLRTKADATITSIGISAPAGEDAAQQTADSLAGALGITITPRSPIHPDLIVVGSQSHAPVGEIALGGSTRVELDSAYGSSALVVPLGKPVLF
jgi:nucleotide-binding universal stress UspA family protein